MFDHITTEQRQNIERYENDLEYRAEIDAKFYSQSHFDDRRDLCTDDGLTPEPKRQVVQYHEHAPFSFGKLLLAFVIVAATVFLLCPLIMFVLFPPV